jgi:hypothetical protein
LDTSLIKNVVTTIIITAIKSLAKIRKAWYNNSMSALNRQIAGGHYKKFEIQPIEFITRNNIPFIEGNIIKYICRWQDKGGVEDLNKVIHYVELLKELKT